MELLDAQKLQLFFLFSVPGMTALYVRAQFLDGRLPSFGDGILIYVAVSLVYHAIWFTFDPAIYTGNIETADFWQKSKWLGLILILPAALGFASALNIQRQWLAKVFEKIGMSTIHPVASAWDWKFSGIQESWVLVTLKNETKWRGVLGRNSFISSSSQERDIFIEKVYEVNDDEVWVPRESGVLITHDQIETIEFWLKGA